MSFNLKDREYRSFAEFNITDQVEGQLVEGYAATFNSLTVLYSYEGIDFKEIIDRNAFTGVDLRDVILNYNHIGKVIARTRNKTLQLTVDDKGLLVRAQLGGTEEGRNLYEEIKGGYLDKMSFAFSVAEDSYDEVTNTRTILRFKQLYDVSVVSLPAYENTSISARNHFQAVAESECKTLDRVKLRERLILKTY